MNIAKSLAADGVVVGRIYRNTKRGGRYRVVLLATHSETDEDMVVYTEVASGRHFARPLALFVGERVGPDGVAVSRFVPEGGDGA